MVDVGEDASCATFVAVPNVVVDGANDLFAVLCGGEVFVVVNFVDEVHFCIAVRAKGTSVTSSTHEELKEEEAEDRNSKEADCDGEIGNAQFLKFFVAFVTFKITRAVVDDDSNDKHCYEGNNADRDVGGEEVIVVAFFCSSIVFVLRY